MQSVMYINQLFRLKDVVTIKHICFDTIKKVRHKKQPVVEDFLSWLGKQTMVRGFKNEDLIKHDLKDLVRNSVEET